jgi:hypothetical protein
MQIVRATKYEKLKIMFHQERIVLLLGTLCVAAPADYLHLHFDSHNAPSLIQLRSMSPLLLQSHEGPDQQSSVRIYITHLSRQVILRSTPCALTRLEWGLY